MNELKKYLSEVPLITLVKNLRLLWFMGVRVELTPIENGVLDAIAECMDEVASREYILKAMKRLNTRAYPQKVDQYVHQLIDKIVAALQEVGEPRYRGDEDTNRWLREEFIVSVRGVGYKSGSLMEGMVIRERLRSAS